MRKFGLYISDNEMWKTILKYLKEKVNQNVKNINLGILMEKAIWSNTLTP